MTADPRSERPIPVFRGLAIAAAPSLMLWGVVALVVRGLT